MNGAPGANPADPPHATPDTLPPMLHPAPTTPIDPAIARGILESVQKTHIVISFPNTSYQMHLATPAPVRAEVGKRILGTIRVDARRIDAVDTGGKYVEPVFGRPRRVQGRVLLLNPSARTLIVDAGMPIHLHLLDDRQRPGDFAPGDLVSCDVREGATFTQQ